MLALWIALAIALGSVRSEQPNILHSPSSPGIAWATQLLDSPERDDIQSPLRVNITYIDFDVGAQTEWIQSSLSSLVADSLLMVHRLKYPLSLGRLDKCGGRIQIPEIHQMADAPETDAIVYLTSTFEPFQSEDVKEELCVIDTAYKRVLAATLILNSAAQHSPQTTSDAIVRMLTRSVLEDGCRQANCKECSQGNCSSCDKGFFLINHECQPCSIVMPYCTQCPQECATCSSIPHCEVCSSSENKCYKCDLGFFVDSLHSCSKCSDSIENCDDCDSFGISCTSCSLGFYNKNGVCGSCSSVLNNCLHCSPDGNYCTSCSKGFYPKNGICKSCANIENCLECSSEKYCFKCSIGYYTSNGICKECSKSLPFCEECSKEGECEKCEFNHALTEGKTCKACNEFIPHCLNCSDREICIDCEYGYRLDKNMKCSNCADSTTNCSRCNKDNEECVECDIGFFLEGTECIDCKELDGQCKECDSTNYCKRCDSYFYASQGRCRSCTQIENCIDCYEPDKCTECSRGFYVNEGKCDNCRNAQSKCKECIQDGSSCLLCEVGFFLDSNSECSGCFLRFEKCIECTKDECTQCEKDYFISDGKCKPCSAIPNCISCKNSYKCDVCGEGYYPEGNKCVKCSIENCIDCSGYSRCVSCEDGYYLDNDNRCSLCSLSISDCKSCSSFNVCTECADHFFLESSQCSSCLNRTPGCINCDKRDGKCTDCSIGKYLDDLNTCSRCSDSMFNCMRCSDANVCEECKDTYYVYKGKCLECSTINNCISCKDENWCTLCEDSTFLNSYKQCEDCSSISPGCIKCDSEECISCNSGYYLAQGKCEECSFGISHCSECNKDGSKCETCQDTYYVNSDYKCSKCEDSLAGCDSCNSQGTSCVKCTHGYFNNSGKCDLCTESLKNCMSCSEDASTCFLCQRGYYKTPDNHCLPCSDIENCLECDDEHRCIRCDAEHFLMFDLCIECSKTFANCKECSDASKCNKCETNYHLNEKGECAECSESIPNCANCWDENTCVTCKEGFYIDTNAKCSNCLDTTKNCAFCNGDNECMSCDKGFFLEEVSCKSCGKIHEKCIDCEDHKVCKSCESDFYLDVGTCKPCSDIPNCKYCKDMKCLKCLPGYETDGSGVCKMCSLRYCSECSNGKCTKCIDGYFTNHLGKCETCRDAMTNCTSCEDRFQCNSCAEGYFLNSNNCLSSCSKEIDYCEDCQSPTACSQCKPGYFVDSNQLCSRCSNAISNCEKCLDSNICLSCSSKYYSVGGSCQDCEHKFPNCDECNPERCTKCKPPFILQDRVCISCRDLDENCEKCVEKDNMCTSCKDGFYPQSQKCYSCKEVLSHCENCSSPNECLKCEPGFAINNDNECSSCGELFDNCIECTPSKCTKCRSSFYLDKTCHKCSNDVPYCLNCPNKTMCNQCQEGYILDNENRCQGCTESCEICNSSKCEKCTEGFFANEMGGCSRCPLDNCIQCNPNACTKCEDTHFLFKGKCIRCEYNFPYCSRCNNDVGTCYECNPGMYLSKNNICLLCAATINHCVECSENGSHCEKCIDSMYFDGERCTSCTGKFPKCSVCNSESCLKCDSGQVPNNNSCEDLFSISNCASFNSDGSCEFCQTGYFLNGKTCSKCTLKFNECLRCSDTSCEECNPGFSISEGTCHKNQCQDTVSQCKAYSPTCNCEECYEGFYIWGFLCLPCSQSVINCKTCSKEGYSCKECAHDYILSNPRSCLPCAHAIAYCEKCDNHSCVECRERFVLAQGRCYPEVTFCQYYYESGECSVCKSGYYLRWNYCYSCSLQINYCKSYDTSCMCELCEDGYFTKNGSCESCSSQVSVSTEFSQDYTLLIIKFEADFDPKDFECQELFKKDSLDLLGRDPKCSWRSSTMLEIALGYEYSLRNSPLQINAGVLVPSSGTCGISISEFPVPKQSRSYPKPKLLYIGDQNYSLNCSQKPLIVAAIVVSGLAQHPASLKWTSEIQIAPGNTTHFVIDKQLLSAGSVVFSLEVTNVYGQTTSEDFTVFITQDYLSVNIDTGTNFTMKQAETRVFTASLNTYCDESKIPAWEWFYLGKSRILSSEVLSNSKQSHKLLVQGNDLKAGFTYRFKVQAKLDSYTGSAYLNLKVIHSDLVAKINRRSGSISSWFNLNLDAKDSYDPEGDSPSLIYKWSCSGCLNKNGSPLIGPGKEKDKNLFISKNDLVNGSIYKFNLKIVKDARFATDSITLHVKNAGLVTIKHSGSIVRASHQGEISLKTAIEGENVSKFEWKLVSGNTVNVPSSNIPEIVFPPSTFIPGKTYQFKATLYSSFNDYIDSSLSVVINEGPECSNGLTVSKFIDNALTLGFYDCFDEDFLDYPLSYSFGVELNGIAVLSNRQSSATRTINVNSGTLIGRVCDSLNTCKDYKQVVAQDEQLLSEKSISKKFRESIVDSDLIPLYVCVFTYFTYYGLISEEWELMFTALEDYVHSLDLLDDETVNSVFVALDGLSKDKTDESQANKILEFMKSFLNKTKKSNQRAFQVLDNILQVEENNQSLENIQDMINLIFRLQMENHPPGQELEVTSHTFSAYKERVQGYELDGKRIKFNNTTVHLPKGLPFANSDIVSISLSVFKNYGSISDAVDLTFSISGSFYKYQIAHSEEYIVKLSDLNLPIQIDISCSADPRLEYSCFFYDDGRWKSEGCTVSSIKNGMCSVLTSHTSMFMIGPIDSTECSVSLSPVYLLGVVSFGIMLLLLAAVRQDAVPPGFEEFERPEFKEIIKEINFTDESGDDSPLEIDSPSERRREQDSFMMDHLLISQCFSPHRLTKTFVLAVFCLTHVMCIGLLLYLNNSVDTPTSLNEQNISEYLRFIAISILVAQTVTNLTSWIAMISDRTSILFLISWSVIGAWIIAAIIGVLAISSYACGGWNQLWTALSIISILIDLASVSFFVSFVKWSIRKKLHYY